MTPRELKAALRLERLAMRDSMAPDARIAASLKMLDHAGDAIEFLPGQVISGFWPIRSEVDIRPLMARLEERGARLCLPAIIDRQTGEHVHDTKGTESCAACGTSGAARFDDAGGA